MQYLLHGQFMMCPWVQKRCSLETGCWENSTDAGRRSVPLSDLAVRQLRTRKDTTSSTLVFPNRRGQLVNARVIRGWFAALIVAADVPPIRLHDLRHTAATLMLAQGTPVHIVSRILGHASASITLSLYAHWLPSYGRDAVDDLERLLLTGDKSR